MKHTLLSLLLVLPFLSFAQKWEVGVFAGSSHYNGDLSEGVIQPETIHPAVGGMLRYNLNYRWAIRAAGYYGTISGSDEYATDQSRYFRNLDFTSTITELSVTPEFHFTGYKIRNKRFKFSPFAFAGLGIYKFNPQTTFVDATGNTRTVSLQPMKTEGQGSIYNQDLQRKDSYPQSVYSLTQIAIPFGFGIKYALGRSLTMTVEVSARKVFTDYLDDVSNWYVAEPVFYQTTGENGYLLSDRRSELTGLPVPVEERIQPRGDSTTNDWYYFNGFTLTYTFFPPACFKF